MVLEIFPGLFYFGTGVMKDPEVVLAKHPRGGYGTYCSWGLGHTEIVLLPNFVPTSITGCIEEYFDTAINSCNDFLVQKLFLWLTCSTQVGVYFLPQHRP